MFDDPRTQIHLLIQAFDTLLARIEIPAGIQHRTLCLAHRMAFREKYAELDALARIIEARMDGLHDPWTRRARLEMNRLEAACLLVAHRAMWAMVSGLERQKFLPLGARDLLENERPAVQGLQAQIREPRFAQFLPDDLAEDLDRIEQALEELMSRAHALPALDQGMMLYSKRPPTRRTGARNAA